MTQFFARPWDSQPQEDVGLSPGFPPAAFVHLPSTQSELVRGATLTANKPARQAGQHGIAYSASGAGGSSARASAFVTSNGAGTGDFTVLVFASPVAANGRQMPFAVTDLAGSANESYFIFNGDSGLTGAAGSFSYTSFPSGSGVTATSAVDGKPHVFVARRVGGVLSLWRDGITLTSGSWSTSVITASANPNIDYVAGYRTAGYGHVDPLFLVAGWNAGLADDQIKRLVNPWQLFDPRRLYIPTAAGGGGAPAESGGASSPVTVTAAGAGNAAEQASGGSSASVSASSAGAGAALEQASGGASASVVVTSVGAGTASSAASGGASAVVSVSAAGAGTAAEAASGGASAAVSITAAGAGTSADGASGGSTGTVSVSAAGAGTATEAALGGASAVVLVTAAGGGLALEIAAGGGSVSVSVSAAGGGTDGAVVVGTEYVRLYSRITPAVAAPSLICPTVALSSPLAVLQGLRSTIDLESP